nr:PIG-L family deacetylase [Sulfobacillus harzensis]
MVVAPHPDDEALGAGGLMAKRRQAGHEVFVALLTVGDGFKEDAARYYLSLAVSPEEYLHMGYERQKETLAALERFGVSRDHVFFLGFPDGGLDSLWLSAWDTDEPWTSPTTGKNRVPYVTARKPDAPYRGETLRDLLMELYQSVRPTQLVMPSAFDTHPDHWATNAFATLAWAEMARQMPAWRSMVRLGYLIHWPAWPMVLAYRPKMAEEPPSGLSQLEEEPWHQEPLESWTVETKRDALMQYQSQVELIMPFMLAFCRRSEAFAVESAWRPARTADGWMMKNPPQDWVTRSVRKTNPLARLTVQRDGMVVEWWKKPPKGAVLEAALKPIDGKGRNYLVRMGEGEPPPGVRMELQGNRWRIVWPKDWLSGADTVMVGAQALVEGKSVGKIPFRVLPWEVG